VIFIQEKRHKIQKKATSIYIFISFWNIMPSHSLIDASMGRWEEWANGRVERKMERRYTE
jgi:hypothetical protein